MPWSLIFVLHFFVAVTTDMPKNVAYPVDGTDLELTCTYDGSDFTANSWEWYRDNQQISNKTDRTLIITGTTDNDGSYHCIALDANQLRSAATPAKAVKFHSKCCFFHPH